MEKVSELEKQLADRENELESYKLNWEHSEDHLQTRVRDQ